MDNRKIRRIVRYTMWKQKRYGILGIIIAIIMVLIPGDIIGSGYTDVAAAIIVGIMGIWMLLSKKPLLSTGIPEIDYNEDEDEDIVRGR